MLHMTHNWGSTFFQNFRIKENLQDSVHTVNPFHCWSNWDSDLTELMVIVYHEIAFLNTLTGGWKILYNIWLNESPVSPSSNHLTFPMKRRLVADHLQRQWPLYWFLWPLTPFLIDLSTSTQKKMSCQSEVLALLDCQSLTFVTYFTKYLPVSWNTSWFLLGDISITRGSDNGVDRCSQETELRHSSPLDPSCQESVLFATL